MAVEFGELEHRGRQPVARDTAFPIGSITKPFTATVAMILVADGDLELDAPLGDYLSDLDDELSDRLTLRHLLSHTSGLVSDVDLDATPGVTLRRYLADHCRRETLLLPSGTAFSYSNVGYTLTGDTSEEKLLFVHGPEASGKRTQAQLRVWSAKKSAPLKEEG